MTEERREGGCLCGAVRYSVAWPPIVVATCSCQNCQKQAGSAFSVIALVPQSTLHVTGALTVYEDKGNSGEPVFRKFCGTCGSPIISEAPAAAAQGIAIIKAGTLDKTDDVTPTVNYWTCAAPAWIVFPDGSSCLEKQ